MSERHVRRKWGCICMFGLCVAGAGTWLWLNHTTVRAWYYVRQLASAEDADRERCVERVATMPNEALPHLLRSFSDAEEAAYGNVRVALDRVIDHQRDDSEASARLVQQLATHFPKMSVRGQRHVLSAAQRSLAGRATASKALSESFSTLLTAAAQVVDGDVRRQSLELAEACGATNGARDVIRANLGDPSAEHRLRVLHLAARPGIEAWDMVIEFLKDAAPEVRHAALLSIGASPEIVPTDDLIRWLHDADPNVRRTCETALRARGLTDDQIKLGHLLSHADARTRLLVLDHLRSNASVDRAVWLRRLSHDEVAAVRAAALRAAVEFPMIDLADRIQQIARNDQSPTMRQLAQYYLNAPKPQ